MYFYRMQLHCIFVKNAEKIWQEDADEDTNIDKLDGPATFTEIYIGSVLPRANSTSKLIACEDSDNFAKASDLAPMNVMPDIKWFGVGKLAWSLNIPRYSIFVVNCAKNCLFMSAKDIKASVIIGVGLFEEEEIVFNDGKPILASQAFRIDASQRHLRDIREIMNH
uniref:Uncharacterized protein n=1 Tax=Tetranychus urticae TaxID=32264 RepID=T1KKF9_TETUR